VKWVQQIAEKEIVNLVMNKKPFELFSTKKKPSEKDIDARAKGIVEAYKHLFDRIVVNTRAEKFPGNFLRFLASISED